MLNPSGAESPSFVLRMIACFVLSRMILFVDVAPDTWEFSFRGNGAFRYFSGFQYTDAVEKQMWLAFLTLLLRLGMSFFFSDRAEV